MPQRDRSSIGKSYPDEQWQAKCAPDAVYLLRRYDHHVVWISGRPALLLTYQWDAEPPARPGDGRTVIVSFTYPAGHPGAPAEVQTVIDQLTLAPISERDRTS